MPPTPQGPNLVWAEELSRKELGLMDEIIQRGVKDIKVGQGHAYYFMYLNLIDNLYLDV